MPLSPTPAQSEASRANGARSHGPVTPEGKAASSRNATRGGFRTDRLELTETEHLWADALRDALARRWWPACAVERAAVEVLVVVEIKLARLDALELRALALELPEGRPLPSLATLGRYRARLLAERKEAEARLAELGRERAVAGGGWADPAPEQLRYLADLAERRRAAARGETAPEPAGAAAPPAPSRADEPEAAVAGASVVASGCTNEPEAAAALPPAAAPRTNEPEADGPASAETPDAMAAPSRPAGLLPDRSDEPLTLPRTA